MTLEAQSQHAPPRGAREANSFLDAQKLASRRLGFSVTQACPLRCRHCSVSASPELSSNRFSRAFLESLLGQMDEIAQAGISSIDFTGGEPTLAADFVSQVAQAAAERSITTGIVTAAHWATSDRLADHFLARFGNVGHWDISTDVYHLEFVPLTAVQRAFERLTELGKRPLVRIAYHDPMTREDALLIEAVMVFAGRNISFQPIGPVGRGQDVAAAVATDRNSSDAGPCPTTGLLLRWDGRGAACCAPASHEEQDHPFWFGNALEEPIVDMLWRWRTDPLLQTLRLWGFSPLLDWFAEAGIDADNILRERTCDQCVAFLRTPELWDIATEAASDLVHRTKLAVTLDRHFQEPWMGQRLQAEAKAFLASGVWPKTADLVGA